MGQQSPFKQQPFTDDDNHRTLQWAEIAGLIDIQPDGSWEPTAYAKKWMLTHAGDKRHDARDRNSLL